MDAPTPWYKRDVIPAWLPGWLAASVLIGAGFALMFGLFLDDPNPLRVAALAGVLGFALGIVILSFAAVQYRGPGPNRFAPPAVVRYPVVTLVAVVVVVGWVSEQAIRRSYRQGGATTFSGAAAEVIGVLVLVLIAAGLTGLIAHDRRAGQVRASVVLSLAIAIGGLVYAAVLLIRHHAG
ncbi:MAG TPA: hypothetical protein VKD90_27285 [Gemmataceae bacterium]|nr:hypothetical protein [Gemmataceae bacterium]